MAPFKTVRGQSRLIVRPNAFAYFWPKPKVGRSDLGRGEMKPLYQGAKRTSIKPVLQACGLKLRLLFVFFGFAAIAVLGFGFFATLALCFALFGSTLFGFYVLNIGFFVAACSVVLSS